MQLPDWSLTIGEIVAPFGLNGEMKVRLETDFPARFQQLKEICLRNTDKTASLHQMVSARPHKNQVVIKLLHINRIEECEGLRGRLVQIRQQDAVPLPENEYYIHQLLGCTVKTETGQVLGSIAEILRSSANDVYVIRNSSSELLLPAIQQVVQSVNLTDRILQVQLLPGLLPDAKHTED